MLGLFDKQTVLGSMQIFFKDIGCIDFLFYCTKKNLDIFFKSMPLDEKIGHTKKIGPTRSLTLPNPRGSNSAVFILQSEPMRLEPKNRNP